MKAALPLVLLLSGLGCTFDAGGLPTDAGHAVLVADGTSTIDLAQDADGTSASDLSSDADGTTTVDGPNILDLPSDLAADADLQVTVDMVSDTPAIQDLAPDQPLPDTLGPDLAGPVCNWTHRRKLSFKNAAQSNSLTGFPVLVVLQQGASIDYNKTQNAGQDIRFTDADGTTLIPHEIETWDEQGKSYLWVQVPQIDGASNTDHIWIYYGYTAAPDGQAPGKVWGSGYVGVWHMNDKPDGTKDDVQDSSPGASHGSSKGGMSASDRVGGPMGWCLDFDGNNDYVDMGDRSQFDMQVYSWSMWLNANGAPTVGSGNEQPLWNADSNFNFSWGHYGAAFKQAAAHKDSADWRAAQIATALKAGTWYYIAATYDGSNITVYLNGSPEDTQSAGAPVSSTGPLTVGGPISGGVPFPGKIDEVRVSNVARSAGWSKAQYLSMTNAFIAYGAEQPAAPGCPK